MPTTIPTITSDSAYVIEDGVLVYVGNVLANDVDPNGYTLSVIAVNGVSITGVTTITGTYGTLVIQPNGAYTYTLNNSQANVRALANGQVVTDPFTYTASDGQSYTQSTTVVQQNLLSQSEAFDNAYWTRFSATGATPTVTANVDPGPTGGASTADKVAFTSRISGLYTTTSVTGQYTFSVWVKLVSGSAAFSFNYWDATTATDHLQSAVATSTWQRLSWTFNGTGNVNSNVALMLASGQASGGVLEFWGAQLNAGASPLSYVATTGTPVNTTTTTTTPVALTGALNVNVTGTVPTINADSGAVTKGGTVTATGNVLANDTGPAAYPLSVVAVNGVSVSSSGTTTIAGVYGTLVIQPSGAYTYNLNGTQANVLALGAGQVVTDAFTYTASDGQTYTQTGTVVQQNLLSQSEAFDNAYWTRFSDGGAVPTVTANADPGPAGGASTADKVAFTSLISGLYTTTGVSGQYTFSVWARLISGSGTFSFNYWDATTDTDYLQTAVATSAWQRLSWTFNGTGDVNSNVALMLASGQAAGGVIEFWGAQLNAGATALAYVATTGTPVNSTTTGTVNVPLTAALTISVTGGAGAGVPTASADTATVVEDQTLSASGNVLANDTDPSGLALRVLAVNGIAVSGTTTITGTYGTLAIQANGAYTYTLNNAQANVRALGNGQSVSDQFSYTISDGQNGPQTVTTRQQNLISQSEAFDSSVWTKVAPTGIPVVIVTPNVGTGPTGGGATADQVNLPGPSSRISTAMTAAGQYTFSFWIRLVSGDGDFTYGYYAGASGGGTMQSGVATSAWQRFTVTFSGDGSASSYVAIMHSVYQAAAGIFQLWGAQVNAGATALPYVATTGSTVDTTTTSSTDPGSTLTVTVTGKTPVAAPDSAAVAVAGTQKATGNLLANDTTVAGTSLTVISVNGQAVSGTTTIAGSYGNLVIAPNGSYTYTLAAGTPLVSALVGGETEQDVFSYTLSNGLSYTAPGTVLNENLITQSEAFDNVVWVKFAYSGSASSAAANNVANPVSGTSTADTVTMTGPNAGVYYVTNVPGVYTFSVWVKLVSGDPNFSFNFYSAYSGMSYLQSAVATSTWQRLSWTFTGDGYTYSNVALMHSASQTATGTYAFWGAELNAGSTPDAYVPTSGSAVTTAAPDTSAATFGSALSVGVSGTDAGKGGPALNLQAQTAAVANLQTDQWTTPLAIMPLGDSITFGWGAQDWSVQSNNSEGYRGTLWRDFVSNGMLVNFVGDQSGGSAALLDKDHAGYPGERTDQILARVPGLMASQHPNAILLMAGTNDVLQGVPQATIIANLTGILNAVAAADPSTHVYLAQLTPLTAFSVTSLNSAIASLVTQQAAAGQNVSLVSMSNITTSDLIYDGTHPSASGYAKMAQNWYNAVTAQQPNQGGTPAGTIATINPTTVNIVGTSGNDLLIGNAQSNILNGGAGNDVLIGGGGADTLIGGLGADQFDITAAAGTVTILDFLPSQGDMLVWDHIPGFTSLGNITSHATVSGGQTMVDLSSSGTSLKVVLSGYTGSLSNSLFLTS